MIITREKQKYRIRANADIRGVTVSDCIKDNPDAPNVLIRPLCIEDFLKLPDDEFGMPQVFTVLHGDMMFYPRPEHRMDCTIVYIDKILGGL